MVKLWANRIVDGKAFFADVPRMLKDPVRQELINRGREDLIIEE